ncbi:MAG TPA: PIG-L deacetylase family protein [Chloroflexia bacterium]|nr:PIG-L deacetylase family protein [Chloroflexia bacterium]
MTDINKDETGKKEIEQEQTPPATRELPPERAMVVVAHPDDIEFGCSGTVARWIQEGAEVAYVICTDGSHGTSDPEITPLQMAKIREQEQRNAAAVVGVKDVTFLGYEDSYLTPTLELRRDISRQIRRFKPDTLIIQNPTRQWNIMVFFDHPDHLAAGEAAITAFYPAARDPHTFPELLEEGYEPHIVKTLYVFAPEGANYWSDISDTIDLKLKALLEHKSQVKEENLGWVKERAANIGKAQGFKYAESFRRVVLQ